MKKFLALMFSVLLLGMVSYTSVSAETSYIYVEITSIETLSEGIYCPTTNSWNCNEIHLHMLITNYKYTLANGDVHYLNSEEVREYRENGIIVGNTMRVEVVVQPTYVEIVSIEYLYEQIYCPTTGSWNCDGIHLHMLIRNYRYTLANGDVYYLNSEEIREYEDNGTIVGNTMKPL